jgi:hypothetical protein
MTSPYRRTIARVTKSHGADSTTYRVDITDTGTQPLLIYCYVIANDNINHWATLMGQRV